MSNAPGTSSWPEASNGGLPGARRARPLAWARLLLAAIVAVSCAPSLPALPPARVGMAAGGHIPIDADDVVIGEPNAPVTLVTFLDYEHWLAPLMLETLEDARREAPQDLRYVIKHFPGCRYPRAQSAANAAAAVLERGGPEAFWPFQQLLLEYQPRFGLEFFRSAARDAGLPEGELASLEDARFAAAVERDRELGLALGVENAPAVFLNGERVYGETFLHVIRREVEAELPQARALSARGLQPAEVYRLRVEENFKPPAGAARAVSSSKKPPRHVPVGDSPGTGPSAAPLTLVEFANFGSGCSKAAQAGLTRLKSEYGARLRVVFKHLAEPPGAKGRASTERWAANFAEFARDAGGDAKFFEAERLLWSASPDLSLARLEQLALALGLDASAALAAVVSDRYAERIDADLALAAHLRIARHAGEYREPIFFINDHSLPNSLGAEARSLIEEQLALAGQAGTRGEAPAVSNDSPSTEPALAPDPALPYRGPRDAPVVVDIFYPSRACALPAELMRLMVEHPASIKLVFRPMVGSSKLADHEPRRRVAEALLEGHAQRGNGGFWAMTQHLCRDYHFRSDEPLEQYAKRDLSEFAKRANLAVDRFRAALADGRHRPKLEAWDAIAKQHGVAMRRTFFVNGQPLGAESLSARIRRLLAPAPPAPPPAPPNEGGTDEPRSPSVEARL